MENNVVKCLNLELSFVSFDRCCGHPNNRSGHNINCGGNADVCHYLSRMYGSTEGFAYITKNRKYGTEVNMLTVSKVFLTN